MGIKLGIMIFHSMATTISSGITIVSNCEGNVPMAVALSTISNFIIVFTSTFSIPFWFEYNNNKFDSEIKISATALIIKLVLFVILPLIIGKLLSLIRKIN